MSALFDYSRQVLWAHHRSPYVRIIVLAVVIHLLLFAFTPPFQVKPYQLDAKAEPPMKLADIHDYEIPAPPPEVPLPPSEVIPVESGGVDAPLPPSFYDPAIIMPVSTFLAEKKPPKFYPFDEAPVLIKLTAPAYPKLARDAGIQGEVRVKVLVGRDGLVKEVSILESNVTDGMEQAALQAARQCHFKPGKQRNKPVPVQVMIPFMFRLDDCD